MDINATVLGYVVVGYMIFSVLFTFLAYRLLKGKRKSVKLCTLMIAILCVLPPLQLIALLVMYLKSGSDQTG
ncbi:MAG: heme/copper-type cytochrome/quinol oxidase subunit 4 [Phenylobacterium sp.]|jgi:heme/copper-type cytochrome/quinol oxidase subunit 4